MLEPRECLLQAQALLRRYNATAPPPPGERRYTIVNFENMRIDSLTRYVCYNGREIELTQREFDLLYIIDLVNHIKVYESGNISVKFKFADELRRIAEYIEINTDTPAQAV